MSIMKVLALIDGGSGSEPALRAGLAVGRTFGAHVELLHVKPSPEASIPLVSDGMTAAAIEQILQAAEQAADERAHEAHALFERLCQGEEAATLGSPSVIGADQAPAAGGFSVAWRQETGRVDQALARRGRLADLVVVPRESGARGLGIEVETALFDTGRPLLLAPPAFGNALGDGVAIAWNGSVEAARAVSAALAFLGRAKRVAVLTAGAGADPADLVAYLAAHGIAAEPQALEAEGSDLAAQLQQAARAAGCDLLVMGAYGHSRLRELVLGGVTDSILRSAELPVLMAH